MKRWFLICMLFAVSAGFAGEKTAMEKKGTDYLLSRQAEDGSWGSHPAITGLVCMALAGRENAAVEKGRAYLLKHVQKDGSIWLAGRSREYPTYTTAITLAALAAINRREDETVMRNARKWLLDLQNTDPDSAQYGGFTYGKDPRGQRNADLSNTQWVAEALHVTDHLDREPAALSAESAKQADLAWDRLGDFLKRLQHLPETNREVWVVSDRNDPNYGGFIYRLDENAAKDMKTGLPQTLRSYGSMTYAGLKSMIYAKMKKEDPRVKAAIGWAARNYTVEENPGVGANGWYYYLQTFAKTHSVLGEQFVTTPDGKTHDWRMDLERVLAKTQRPDGSWINEKSGRWMESMPELVTAYAMLALRSR